MKKLNKLILGLFAFVAFIAFGMIPGSEVHAATVWKNIGYGDTIKAGTTLKLNGETDCLTGESCDDLGYISNWINNDFQCNYQYFIDNDNTREIDADYLCYEYLYCFDAQEIQIGFEFGIGQTLNCGCEWFDHDLEYESIVLNCVKIYFEGEVVCNIDMCFACPAACEYGTLYSIDTETTVVINEDIVIPEAPNPEDLSPYIAHVLVNSFVYQTPASISADGYGDLKNLSAIDEKTYCGDITIDSNYVINNTSDDFTLNLGYMNQFEAIGVFFDDTPLENSEVTIYRRCKDCHTSNIACGDSCDNVRVGTETYCEKVSYDSTELYMNNYSLFYDFSSCCGEDEIIIDFKNIHPQVNTYILCGDAPFSIANPFDDYTSKYELTGEATDFTKVDSINVDPIWPTYEFPEVGEIPFSSFILNAAVTNVMDPNVSQEDFEYYDEKIGDHMMYLVQAGEIDYWRTFTLRGTYTNKTYSITLSANGDGNTSTGVTYDVVIDDGTETTMLSINATYQSIWSAGQYYINTALKEYMFDERVVITADTGWQETDPETGASSNAVGEEVTQYLDVFSGIAVVDYGDLIAPSINTELHITSSTDAPLSINEILNMITVKDETDGDISQNVTLVSTTYDPQNLVLGKHPFNVSVSDAAGNEATATFYVTVYDVTSPVIDGINSYSQSYDDPITLDDILANLTVTDNFDEDVTINLVRDGYTGNEAKVGTYNVIFNATDTAGNSCVDYVVSVEVFDKKAPIVTAPDNIECGNDKLLTLPEIQSKISVIDGCDGKLEYTINGYDAYRATYSTVKQYPITITATDKSCNATNHTIVLEVKDEVEPKFFIARNFVISITAGEVITNDMIISFLTQVGEIRKANVDFVQASYEDVEGEYEVLVFMKDSSVYKTSIRVGAQEVEIEEKVGFWTKVGNWFKSIPNFFTKSIPNFFTKTIPGWFKGMGEKISAWWNNLWPWTKDKEPAEEPEAENEPSIEGEPALALEPAIAMTVTDEFVVYEYPEFECDPGVPATMPELA